MDVENIPIFHRGCCNCIRDTVILFYFAPWLPTGITAIIQLSLWSRRFSEKQGNSEVLHDVFRGYYGSGNRDIFSVS